MANAVAGRVRRPSFTIGLSALPLRENGSRRLAFGKRVFSTGLRRIDSPRIDALLDLRPLPNGKGRVSYAGSHMHQGRIPADICPEPLPDRPELALFVATLFERLGGTLEIDRHGRRLTRRPDRRQLHHHGLPQLADARPWERFRSHDEWQGAIKLAEYWLARLSAADREHVFTLLAAMALDREDQFDFRERL